jgi:hypothetical protein
MEIMNYRLKLDALNRGVHQGGFCCTGTCIPTNMFNMQRPVLLTQAVIQYYNYEGSSHQIPTSLLE